MQYIQSSKSWVGVDTRACVSSHSASQPRCWRASVADGDFVLMYFWRSSRRALWAWSCPSTTPWTYLSEVIEFFPCHPNFNPVGCPICSAVVSGGTVFGTAMMSLTDDKLPRAGQIFVHSKSASKELPSATDYLRCRRLWICYGFLFGLDSWSFNRTWKNFQL